MKRLTPNSIKNIDPYVLANPLGVDMVVNALQARFDLGLTWLEKSFGRAVAMSHQKDNQKIDYPGLFVKEGFDYMNMIALDNWDAYSFFFARDTEDPLDFGDGIRNTFRRELDLIFWINLERADSTKEYDYLPELKREILNIIDGTTYSQSTDLGQVLAVDVLNVYDEPDNIFDGFDIDLEDTQLLYWPYRGLRITLDCTYIQGCDIPLPPAPLPPCSEPDTWDELVAIIGRGYNYPIPDSVTQYRVGDSASIEISHFGSSVRLAESLKARNTLESRLVLSNNNSFGNTDRFTDDAGGQIYANNYAIDHYTGLGWTRDFQGVATWDNSIDNALTSATLGFSDWFLPNMNQLFSLNHYDQVNTYVTYIGALYVGTNLWTSTTNGNSTTKAEYSESQGRISHILIKTSTRNAIYCRKHF